MNTLQHKHDYDYPRSLLQAKRRELRAVELNYQNNLIPTIDYLSCRRSLCQAINELETLLQGAPHPQQ